MLKESLGWGALVTSTCWAIGWWILALSFEQHWPQPVPPWAVKLTAVELRKILAELRKQSGDTIAG